MYSWLTGVPLGMPVIIHPACSGFVETMLTTVETCRQQNRNVWQLVNQAVAAHFAPESAPPLLPGVFG
jgi:hypothetical protein